MQFSDRWGKSALSRREFVGKLAVGAAGAAVASAVTVGTAAALSTSATAYPLPEPANGDGQPGVPRAAAPIAEVPAAAPQVAAAPAPEPAPWGLLQPLALGSVLAHGWRVAGLTGVVDGSCVLTLQSERGRTHRVHLCRNDGRPEGLVFTERFDLLVMNGGQGDLPSDEGMAQAVADVAHAIAANEAHGPHAPVVAALLPHAERVERFASAAKLR